eukprot:XP_003728882.2 PREDICTED: uncharacterized protein LOC100892929 [Strongylocentrotus purpuratus]
MDPSFRSNRSCSTGEEEHQSDLARTERRGVKREDNPKTSVDSVSKVARSSNSPGINTAESPHTLETPSTSSQQPMIKENVAPTREQRHIANSDMGHVEELTESMMIQNRGSNRSTLGQGSMSEIYDAFVMGDAESSTGYIYREKEMSEIYDAFVMGDAESSVKVLPTSGNEKIARISQGITREEIINVKSSALDITYSMWDFGGQEIYYITHPLFLSWRSLYILVIPLHLELSDDAPRKEDEKQLKGSAVRTHRTILDLLHFWLMSVYTHAVPESHLDSRYEPKVLLIGTFAGDEGLRISKEKVESKVQELKEMIESKPYKKQVLFPICVIDNQFSERSEVNKIQDRIDGLVKDSEYMKVRKPIKWRTFLTEIEGSDQNTLTVKEVSRADIIVLLVQPCKKYQLLCWH